MPDSIVDRIIRAWAAWKSSITPFARSVRRRACELEKRAALANVNVVLTDVSQNSEALRRAGVTLDQVGLKMHAIDANGRVLAGMPAVALAWAATPPYRRLGRVMQIQPFSWIGAAVYHLSAHLLWGWKRACGRW